MSIEQLKQNVRGEIPKTENLLQSAIKNSAINFALSGIPAAMNPDSRPEEGLPSVAQFGTDFAFNATPQGRMAAMIPGAKYGATVGAAGIAELMRQGTKGLRGEGVDLGEAGKNTAITAGTELIGRGAENALFRSQIGKDVIDGAQKRLGEGIRRLIAFAESNPGFRVFRDDVIGMIDDATRNVLPVGPQASAMRRLRAAIGAMPEEIGPQEIANIENTLGGIAQFDPGKGVKNKGANVAAKESRGRVSGLLDSMAESAGMPDVPLASKEASLAYKVYRPKKLGIADLIARKVGTMGAVGAVTALATKNPLMGAAASMADLLLESPGVKDFLYKGIVKSGASRTGRVGISEVIKKNS